MTLRLIVCIALASSLCAGCPLAVASTISTVVPVGEQGEAGFRLHGSHGYSIGVMAYPGEDGGNGAIEFVVRRRNAWVSYRASAEVTEEGISASLGGIARVELARHGSGREKKVHLPCTDIDLTYEEATYEGTLEFRGENRYSQARVSRVAQLPASLLFLGGRCSGEGRGEVSGPGEPGARLRGISFAHGRSLLFQLNKNRVRSPVAFAASLKERRDGIRIDREVAGQLPSGAFRFDSDLRTATLNPPAPFSASASLSRSRDSFSPIWTGDLELRFPGSEVSLAGPDVHVSLVHARFNRNNDPTAEIGF